MAKIVIEMTDEELAGTIDKALGGWYSITCEPQTLRTILERPENRNLFLEIAETEGKSSLDTCVRDQLADVIAKEITEMDWPMNGDSPEYKEKFFSALKKNAKEKGFVIEEGAFE